jgi:exonuclease V gamma subunit
MNTTDTLLDLPSSASVRQRIEATEDELKALRRLLRAAVAAEKAKEAHRRRRELTEATHV